MVPFLFFFKKERNSCAGEKAEGAREKGDHNIMKLNMGAGDSGSASKNTSDPFLKIRKKGSFLL